MFYSGERASAAVSSACISVEDCAGEQISQKVSKAQPHSAAVARIIVSLHCDQSGPHLQVLWRVRSENRTNLIKLVCAMQLGCAGNIMELAWEELP